MCDVGLNSSVSFLDDTTIRMEFEYIVGTIPPDLLELWGSVVRCRDRLVFYYCWQ